jgi:hypothetical protein
MVMMNDRFMKERKAGIEKEEGKGGGGREKEKCIEEGRRKRETLYVIGTSWARPSLT